MTSQGVRRWITVGALLVLPVIAHAQEATLSGTVTDTTGGALPGATVRAVHESSGNSFESVTDERGAYRIPARVGAYRLTADLPGFVPVTRTLTLLVGQTAVVDLQLAVSGVQESVTVTGEAPLLDVTQSSMGGNVDPRQLSELPVQGRSWMDLVMVAPGARVNAMASDSPSSFGSGRGRNGGDFGLNVDGQQVTNLLTAAGDGQPRFSRDAIAEFEFVSSRFDATQGRSSGMQINAVTKSGTNTPSGSFSGYFRHDRFNAADHVAGRVLPYQDQQLVGTFGGPIRRDKIHFFGHFEYEREPVTILYQTPYAHFNGDLSDTRTEKKAGGRVDAQFSPRLRLSVRGNAWRQRAPSGGGSDTTPSSAGINSNTNNYGFATLTHVLSNRTVNEVKAGYAKWFLEGPGTVRAKNPKAKVRGQNGPAVLLRGIDAGGNSQYPQDQTQTVYSIRDDLTLSFAKGGRHTLKTGGEYLYTKSVDFRCIDCEGELNATLGPLPVPVETLFPNIFDVSTWNLRPLSPVTREWRQVFQPSYEAIVPRYSSAAWLQDDWAVAPKFTLNLGVRYDLEINAFNNDVEILPFRRGRQPDDKNNVAPRVGFNWSVNDRTVLRGGGGLYVGTVVAAYATNPTRDSVRVRVVNDGRPDFASNPFNGPEPSYQSLIANVCDRALVPGCVLRDFPTSTATIYAPDTHMPYAYQASAGVQRQIGAVMAFEADYVYTGDRDNPRPVVTNLSFNPATGANYPFSDISRRPNPEWGFVKFSFNGTRANYHALQTALTKRFSNRWQGSATYTLGMTKDADPPARSGMELVPFPVVPDLSDEYTEAAGSQRHRAVFNGIWDVAFGFQLSGLYQYGSGQRFETRYGLDLRQIGTNTNQSADSRLRPDGTLVPRNGLIGKPIHRVDLRVQRRIPLGGRAGIDGLLEIFNVFDHANYGAYTLDEVNRSYGKPRQSTNVAYAPRTMQLGFRFSF